MKKILLFYFLLLLCFTAKSQPFPTVDGANNLTYKIISSAGKTWGYDIYNNDKLLVHQPSIPALPGNEGFKTKAAAEKVAKKVIEKIGRGENPPTVFIDEMKQLGVIPKE